MNADPGSASIDAGPASNADSAPVASDCDWALHFDSCALPAPPRDPLTLVAGAPWLFNTTLASFVPPILGSTFVTKVVRQTSGGPDVLVLYTAAFRLPDNAILNVTGDKPLVIASDSTIDLRGTLDVSGQVAGQLIRGPGANNDQCSRELDGSSDGDGGGGGGGGFAAGGGPGGAGNDSDGGVPGNLVTLPKFIRGGCPGGAGGKSSGGRGGDGGGAIELAARDAISVSGNINAGGAGGGGGGVLQAGGGGGGGGSGGMVSLDAQRVTVAASAKIAANGGGGGGGADKAGGGANGGNAALVASGALGGASDRGHDGGLGGAVNPLAGGAGKGRDENGGGGGGGGAVGFVLIHTGSFSAQGAISPFAAQLPFQTGS